MTTNISKQIPPSLPNSFTYEFPATGHVPLYPNPDDPANPVTLCAQSIAAQFMSQPTKRPNSSCIATLPQMDFTP